MYTLVHERIYMRDRDRDRESLSTYETALCKLLDVNKYRAHLETSLKTSVVTIATIVQTGLLALIHVTLYELQ